MHTPHRLVDYLKLSGLVLIASLALSSVGYGAYQVFRQYAEDTAHVSGDLGVMMLGVRNDAQAALTTTDGDYSPVRVTSSGLLATTIVSTTGTANEDVAETAGMPLYMMGTVRRDTAASSAGTTGDNATLNTDANGNVWTIDAGVGATADAAATAGSTGSTNAKLRLMTTQLDAIQTAVETLDNIVSGSLAKVQLTDSGGNEIVVPTAGLTHYDAADASTNATNVKASAGTVYHYSLSNTTSTLYYLRMYNASSAPTCSSATNFVESIPIPAGALGGGRERVMNIGQAFTTGISYCITASSGSTANDNAAAGVFVTILYK